MSAHEFSACLERSLDGLAQETPRSLERIRETLGSRRIRFEADGDSFVLEFRDGVRRLSRSDDAVDVTLGLDRDAVCDLVMGRISLEDALLTDRLELRAPIEALDDFFAALRAYLDGAVRAPSLPGIFDVYRAGRSVPQP